MASTPEAPLLTRVPGIAFTVVTSISYTGEGTMIHLAQHEESGRVMSFLALLKGSREMRPAMSEASDAELVSASAAPSASAAAIWLDNGDLSSAVPQAAAVAPVPQLARVPAASDSLDPATAATVAPMTQLAAVPVAAASVTPAVPQAVAVPLAPVALPAAPLAVNPASAPSTEPGAAAPVASFRWGQAHRPQWKPHTDIRLAQGGV